MKLKYYLDSSNKKIYTLKENVDGKSTSDAHYKFIKIHNTPKDGIKNLKF